MADALIYFVVIYGLMIQFAKYRTRWKPTLIAQFFLGWLTIELAAFHALTHIALLLMALGDLGDWQWSTSLAVLLAAFNIRQLQLMHQLASATQQEFAKTLAIGLGDKFSESIAQERLNTLNQPSQQHWYKPFSLNTDQYQHFSNITYGPEERNTLDLFKPKDGAYRPRPVMLQIHGGGWMLGYGERQALPLRNRLIEAGWIFVSINYRLSPKHRMPAHLVDCKRAVAWIKANIAEYGGNPDFILTTGGSAGGHLCSLLALTANQHLSTLQPGFEECDTTVQGCLPMYGVYDLTDSNQHRADLPVQDFLEQRIMPTKLDDDADFWRLMSPTLQVHADAPPFMVTHGQLDTLSFVEDAQYFAKALRKSSNQPCVYTELEQTQHAFDIFNSPRCLQTVDAMHTFSEWVYSRYLK
ncbi:MAG: alpha/beta hydrolase [Pseudomonadales bacterium]|nr:alpha/beta hydrolase [Pseudomonadales bacterium]